MFIKKKLKDVTKEEFEQWRNNTCSNIFCINCMFKNVICSGSPSWINSKEIFSDKFLNQEIEIEVPDILDKEEKEYLSNVVKPFRNRVSYIVKFTTSYDDFEYICIYLKNMQGFSLPSFKKDTMYKGMKINKAYILKELGL